MEIFKSPSMDSRCIVFLLRSFLWLLLSSICYGVESDIQCLRGLHSSLDDPNKYLGQWNFHNNTEGFICKFNGIECWSPDESRVLNVRLSNMGLKGTFPFAIRNCTSLTGLDLSSNELSGVLPEDISRMIPYVTTLDLSDNNFNGPIPVNLSNCSYLNVLNLEHNRLTGPIPWQLNRLDRLSQFSVAGNSLTGQIPTFANRSFPVSNFANNPGLCGKPLDLCKSKGRKTRMSTFTKVLGMEAVGGVIVGVIAFVLFLYWGALEEKVEEEDETQ